MPSLNFKHALITLTGCTVPGNYYLRNLSELPAILTIVLDKSFLFGNKEKTSLRYTNEVKDIKFGMYEKFETAIQGQNIGNDSVRFTIPPKSIVYLGSGANTDFRGGFIKAIIKVGDTEENFDINSHEQMNINSKGFFRYTGYYDIKH